MPRAELLELAVECDEENCEQPPDVILDCGDYCAKHALWWVTSEYQVLSGHELLRRERLGLN